MEAPRKPARLSGAQLVLSRGSTPVAGPVDFALEAGEALAVTGPNGAGKSTLLRTLFGLLPPGSGQIAFEGLDGADGEPAANLGEAAHYLGHRNGMKGGETVEANLLFWMRFLGGKGRDPAQALAAVGLDGAGSLPFAYLSAGQQRRAALARLLVSHRPVWLLDEPTSALDSGAQALFGRIASQHLDGGGIVIAATHLPLGIPAREMRLEPAVLSPTLAEDAWA
nr:heme ABC exporter ATP-binding protein CcmA [Aureimonas psammosilenae]